jgi:hypothetical protein
VKVDYGTDLQEVVAVSNAQKLDLNNIAGGEMSALVQRAFVKIAENIADPNVPNEGVRKLKLTIKVKPDKKGQTAQIVYEVKTELPGAEPGQAMAYIAMDSHSKEITLFNADVRQEALFQEPMTTEIKPIGEHSHGAGVPAATPGYAPPLKGN